MYNDYYLQQIDNKIATTNTKLDTIITNQTTLNTSINNMGILLCMIISTILIYKFIERCLR